MVYLKNHQTRCQNPFLIFVVTFVPHFNGFFEEEIFSKCIQSPDKLKNYTQRKSLQNLMTGESMRVGTHPRNGRNDNARPKTYICVSIMFV